MNLKCFSVCSSAATLPPQMTSRRNRPLVVAATGLALNVKPSRAFDAQGSEGSLSNAIESFTPLMVRYRRSVELEQEIRDLHDRLAAQRQPSQTSQNYMPLDEPHWVPSTPGTGGELPHAQAYNSFTRTGDSIAGDSRSERVFNQTAPVAPPPLVHQLSVATVDTARNAYSPGITTVPGVDPPSAGRLPNYTMPRPMTLGNVTLSILEIEELFHM